MTDKLEKEVKRLNAELEKTKKDLEDAQRIIKRKTVELKAVMTQAEEVSHVDELTCLPNRRQVVKTLQLEVNRAERYKTKLAISMIDIDHFKKINDSYGHTIGDEALFHLANMLRDDIREPDLVGRYGGEEFLVVLPNTGLREATEQAKRICKRIREKELIVDRGEKLFLTVSIGVAEYKHGQENWQNFLSRADMALYAAKSAGRNTWAVSE